MISLGRDLREMSFSDAVAEIIRGRGTGALELHQPLGVSRAYFIDGVPQGARLARMKHPVGRLLVERDYLTERELQRALATQSRDRKRLGEVLLQSGKLTEKQLAEIIGLQARLNFFSLFEAHEGRLAFKEGDDLLDGFMLCPQPALSALYEGLRYAGRRDTVAPALARYATEGVQLKKGETIDTSGLGPAECRVIGRLGEPCFAPEIARSVPLKSDDVAFLLVALDEMALIEPVSAHRVARR